MFVDNYLLYIAIASATIISPGPGVVLSISNALKYGFFGAVPGILGIAFGIFIIAIFSATGIAVVIETSSILFIVIKYMGVLYLLYLGLKMWCSTGKISLTSINNKSNYKRFLEGLLITILNPKPIFFFMALFPQFIDINKANSDKFFILILIFVLLVIVIHFIYASCANVLRNRLSNRKGNNFIIKFIGSLYIFFGLGLALSNK